ncbi:multicopper oxidase family protein [Rhodobacteraceae bacterium M382]|nr:multicopper oxidase family protein [Rhodobacteraceae bacterium M382]
MKRRHFLGALTGAAVAPRISWAGVRVELVAHPVEAQILFDDFPPTPMLGFNGTTPGPALRVRQGDFLDLLFRNQIKDGSAVHWHGVRSDNAMDGVPGLTQDIVEPGAEFAYRLRVPDAGTFWYHSHNRSWEQVAKGLYGPLIVEETSPPDVDHELIVLIDDWRMTEEGALAPGFDNRHDQAHQGRLGNFARALIDPDSPVRRGDRLRLRLINVATDRIFPIDLGGLEGKIVALDGMPLPTPQPITDVVLAPAQRVDIIADVTATNRVTFDFPVSDGPYALGEILVDGENTNRRSGRITALPPNRMPTPDLEQMAILQLNMQGGAMSSAMRSQTDIWAFNGQSGLTNIPFHRFERGQTARITLMNDTRFAHGIHLHGHHFFELNDAGDLGAFRDTTLVNPGEKRDILCVFDNPGKWLLHCHMLGHQAAGMKTWIDVA